MPTIRINFPGMCLFHFSATNPADSSVLLVNAMKVPVGGSFKDCRDQKSGLNRHEPFLSFELSDWDIEAAADFNAIELVTRPDWTQFARISLAGLHLAVVGANGPVNPSAHFNNLVPSLEDALGSGQVTLKPGVVSGPFGAGNTNLTVARFDLAEGELKTEPAAQNGGKHTIMWHFSETDGGNETYQHELTELVYHERTPSSAILTLQDVGANRTFLELEAQNEVVSSLTISNLPVSPTNPHRDKAPHFRWYYWLVDPCPSTQPVPRSKSGPARVGPNAFCPPAQVTE